MNNLISETKDRYPLFILLVAAMMFIFAYSWVPGSMDVDSMRYAVMAKEISRTNSWLGLYDPMERSVFYYHFPLCIWVTAIFYKLFGISDFSAKLFSMLSGVTLVGVIFYFGRLLKNSWVGFFAGFSFLFTNHILRIARKSRLDIPLSLFIALAVFSFFLAQRRSRLYYLLFGLFTCLAIFTKDIVGLAPLGIVFVYLAMRFKWKEFFHPLFILGLAIAVIPVFIWIFLDRAALFNSWFNWQFMHLLKYHSCAEHWYYYVWVIITKYFYFLPFAIYGGYLAVREAHRNKNYELYLLIIWVVVFPIIFSFGKNKVHYYILPMYPAAALLTGIAFDKFLKDREKLNILAGLKYILITAFLILACFPLNIRGRRYEAAIHMAPVIDQILKYAPEYEFIIYKQDQASLLFYSRELKEFRFFDSRINLEDALAAPAAKPIFLFSSGKDFAELGHSIKGNFRAILKYQDKVLTLSKEAPEIIVTLP